MVLGNAENGKSQEHNVFDFITQTTYLALDKSVDIVH